MDMTQVTEYFYKKYLTILKKGGNISALSGIIATFLPAFSIIYAGGPYGLKTGKIVPISQHWYLSLPLIVTSVMLLYVNFKDKDLRTKVRLSIVVIILQYLLIFDMNKWQKLEYVDAEGDFALLFLELGFFVMGISLIIYKITKSRISHI